MATPDISVPDVPPGMDPRHSTDADRAACMVSVERAPRTLLEEKMVDPSAPGTAGDRTGIAAEIIRSHQRYGQ